VATVIQSTAIFVILLFSTFSYAIDTVNIGVSLGLTGEYSVMSKAQMNGFKLWQSHINERGGLLGKKVNVIIKDDKSDPNAAKEIYEEFITKGEAQLLFAPYSTKLTSAVLPIAERYRIPLLISGAAGDSLWEKGYKYAIGVYTPSSKFINGFAEILLKAGIRDVAVVHAEDGFSKDLARAAQQVLFRYGLNQKALIPFNVNTVDYNDLVKAVKESNAEAIILCVHFENAVAFIKAAEQLGLKPKALYASVGAATPEFYKALGDKANGVFSTALWVSRVKFPGNERFYKDYLKTYGYEPPYHAALAYAAGQVLEGAVRAANSLDPERLRETLFKLDEMTIIGRYGIDSTGKQVHQHSFITQWQRGKMEIMWPEKVATSRPIIR